MMPDSDWYFDVERLNPKFVKVGIGRTNQEEDGIANATAAAVQNMRNDHRRADALVAKQHHHSDGRWSVNQAISLTPPFTGLSAAQNLAGAARLLVPGWKAP